MTQARLAYRCSCGRLLSRYHIQTGHCQGHSVKYATTGSLFEFLLLKWWGFRGYL